MFCGACGRKIVDETRFCQYCGMPNMDALEKGIPQPIDKGVIMCCEKCGVELLEDSLFCDQCGARVEKKKTYNICKVCRRKIESDSSFCYICGSKQ